MSEVICCQWCGKEFEPVKGNGFECSKCKEDSDVYEEEVEDEYDSLMPGGR